MLTELGMSTKSLRVGPTRNSIQISEYSRAIAAASDLT